MSDVVRFLTTEQCASRCICLTVVRILIKKQCASTSRHDICLTLSEFFLKSSVLAGMIFDVVRILIKEQCASRHDICLTLSEFLLKSSVC